MKFINLYLNFNFLCLVLLICADVFRDHLNTVQTSILFLVSNNSKRNVFQCDVF